MNKTHILLVAAFGIVALNVLQAKNIEISIRNWLPANVYVSYKNCQDAEEITQQIAARLTENIYIDAPDDEAAGAALLACCSLYSPFTGIIPNKWLVDLYEKMSPTLWDGINICISQTPDKKVNVQCLAYKRAAERPSVEEIFNPIAGLHWVGALYDQGLLPIDDDFDQNAGYNWLAYLRRERLWPDMVPIKPILMRENSETSSVKKVKYVKFKHE